MSFISSEEITHILKKEIENFATVFEENNYGTVIMVGDNIAQIYGLSGARAGELLQFEDGTNGIVLNLEEYNIGCVILGSDAGIKEGQKVTRTGRITEVPVGPALEGRVVNSLGKPIDGKGPITTEEFRPVEFTAPKVMERMPVNRPLFTGIKAIDSLVPIGRGQREMIIGDRQTGKTAIAVDIILNQIPQDVHCIYVAIGQKVNSVASVIDTLKRYDRLKNTTVVVASANDPASMLYIAPYSGCAMAEYYMYNGQDALVIYDDLSKHANAYRELSLLLRRPPGREAYPGDVFYLHSRLLERSAQLSEDLGAGSSTALPIIETQMGDVSAYIPTNVISITDGQIYLDRELFHKGIRPAVDVGLSVSRVGGSAQIKAMKQVAGSLRLDLAQFRELEAFLKFSSDELDKSARMMINRGKRITEALKQRQFNTLPVAYQVAIIYAVTKGQFDDIPVDKIQPAESAFFSFLKDKYPEYQEEIESKKKLTSDAENMLKEAFEKFKSLYFSDTTDSDSFTKDGQDENFEKKVWKNINDKSIEAQKHEEQLKSGLENYKK